MSSPYQNQTVVVHNNVNVNNNVNEDCSTVKTHKKKKKNIRYTGTTLLFLTIVVAVVAVTVMISARKVPPTLFGSLTNTNVLTSTSTAIMSSDEDDDETETWYDATEEQDEAGQHDDSDTDTGNNSDRFDPHEYPPVQYTPKKEATGGYGNTVTVTKQNTKKKCPACYFPTSTLVENGNVCQQLCHDTQQEQTQAVRKGRGWNFLGTNKVQDNWCAGTYLSTNEVQVGKDNFRMACTFKTGGDTGGSIFDKS